MKKTLLLALCMIACLIVGAAIAAAIVRGRGTTGEADNRDPAALKRAQDAAIQAKDLDTAQQLQAQIDKASAKSPSGKTPYAGKSFESPKYGKITFRDDGVYLSSDQPGDTAKWFRIDDTHALVWTQGGWATLFAFDQGNTSAFSVGHVDSNAAWVAPALPGQ